MHPKIINTDLQQIVKLLPSVERISKNGFSHALMLIFYDELDVGHYCLEILEHSSLNSIKDKLSQTITDHLQNFFDKIFTVLTLHFSHNQFI